MDRFAVGSWNWYREGGKSTFNILREIIITQETAGANASVRKIIGYFLSSP